MQNGKCVAAERNGIALIVTFCQWWLGMDVQVDSKKLLGLIGHSLVQWCVVGVSFWLNSVVTLDHVTSHDVIEVHVRQQAMLRLEVPAIDVLRNVVPLTLGKTTWVDENGLTCFVGDNVCVDFKWIDGK